jgi:hypothetical protein
MLWIGGIILLMLLCCGEMNITDKVLTLLYVVDRWKNITDKNLTLIYFAD